MSPLIIAAEQGAVELVKKLVAAGADVGIESRIGTALHRAAFTGQTEVIRVLLAAGAKTEVMSRRFYPLHLAAMTGHLEAVSALVKGGADVNSFDGGSRTPLHRVLNASNPHVSEIARFFIDGGADIDTTDEDGKTPLMTAVREGYTEVVRSLLEKGARTDVRDRNFNQTLLHLAAIRGYGDIAEILLSRGLDANARDVYGATPVTNALIHGNATVVGVLDVPIPNTEVKPFGADGTAEVTRWESRSLPGFFYIARIVFNERIKEGARALIGHTPLLYYGQILIRSRV